MHFNGDPLAFYGKLIIEAHHASLLEHLPKLKLGVDLTDPFKLSDDEHPILSQLKVGILGAGIGGLYTALILDSLNIQYEILEASERVGGRLKTYKFQGGGEYDYYEEGAMRFPLPKKDEEEKYKNGTMKRLAELIEYPPLNTGSDPLKNTLIPYYFTARNPARPGFYYFNGEHQLMDGAKGSFKAQDMGVSADYIQAGSSAIHGDVINPFVRVLINDLETDKKDGWTVMKENDSYSVRGYMASKYLPSYSLNLSPRHLSNDVINWVNLLESSSGGYDRALTESVFSALAFANVGGNNYGDVDWKCFKGGSETLSNKIKVYLESKGTVINIRHRVTGIHEASVNNAQRAFPAVGVSMTTPTESKTEYYSHVISTLPLTVLRTINLQNAGLNVLQRNALRALDYGPSIKIAILFETNWWTTKLGIIGGQSYTDLPIRTIVYPSYGVDTNTPPRVLIASYSWTNDASRLGALALKADGAVVLKELVLRNLAEAHSHFDSTITYQYLVSQCKGVHVKDWNIDEYAMGAFANFSPGEFENLYTSLSVPAANSCLHFAGEAVSTRHGWVVGALDSAWKSVYEYLKITGQDAKIVQFKEIWGGNTEWTTDSTLVEDGPDHDLLDEHVGLIRKAILAGLI